MGLEQRGLEKFENFNSQGGAVAPEMLFFIPFLTMKTTLLGAFPYTVKVK